MSMVFNRATFFGAGVGLALLLGVHGVEDVSVAGFAAVLAGIAMLYPGALLSGTSDARVIMSELGVAGLTCLCVVLGLLYSPLWLAVGCAGHALWDWAHHFDFGARVSSWYPPFCAAADGVIALGIVWIFI